jgi:hypothetical protein
LKLLAAKAEVSPVIETNHIEPQFTKRLFLGLIPGYKGFCYLSNSASLQMKPGNRADNLNLLANVQSAHKPLLTHEFFFAIDTEEKAVGTGESRGWALKLDNVFANLPVLREQGQNLHDPSRFAPAQCVVPSHFNDVSDVKHAVLHVLGRLEERDMFL